MWRKLEDNPYFSNPKYVALWVHLLLLATHKELEKVFQGARIALKPGQLITGRKFLSQRTGIAETTIERLLDVMESERQIGQQKTTKNRLITVLNWDKYQKDGQQTDNKRTTNGHIQEGKNVKNDKKTTNNIASPTAPQEDLRKIVNKFFDLQSYEESDRKASFPRHVRDAKQLLQACQGDSGKACAVLDALHAWGAKKKLSYTIGTALKRWKDFSGTSKVEDWDAKMKRVQAEIDKYQANQTP